MFYRVILPVKWNCKFFSWINTMEEVLIFAVKDIYNMEMLHKNSFQLLFPWALALKYQITRYWKEHRNFKKNPQRNALS